MKFSQASENIMKGVHPDLVKVMRKAITITTVDFKITEGLRTLARQKELVGGGASWTMNSRHLTGHAVDVAALVAGKVRWDWPLYYKIADAVFLSAKELQIPIAWGGNWKKPRQDGPHFELDRKFYP